MRTHIKQPGFSLIELVLVLAVVGVLGFLGYSFYNRQNANNAAQTASSEPAQANDVASSPNINSTSDLDKALATLDQTDPSGGNNTDSSQLDSELSNF